MGKNKEILDLDVIFVLMWGRVGLAAGLGHRACALHHSHCGRVSETTWQVIVSASSLFQSVLIFIFISCLHMANSPLNVPGKGGVAVLEIGLGLKITLFRVPSRLGLEGVFTRTGSLIKTS